MRPSQGHRSRTLGCDLVQTGGLSRSDGLPGLYRESIRQVAIPGGFYTLYGRLPASRYLLQASNTGGNLRLEPDGRCTLHMNSLACTVS